MISHLHQTDWKTLGTMNISAQNIDSFTEWSTRDKIRIKQPKTEEEIKDLKTLSWGFHFVGCVGLHAALSLCKITPPWGRWCYYFPLLRFSGAIPKLCQKPKHFFLNSLRGERLASTTPAGGVFNPPHYQITLDKLRTNFHENFSAT